MLTKVGLSLQKKYDVPFSELIPMLKEYGFSAVSPLWSPETDLAEISESARNHNMLIQSLHAAYDGIALLWEPENDMADAVRQNIFRSIDDCVRFEIATLVMHGWAGLIYTFPDEPLNFYMFDKIVEYAEKNEVTIAFENLEGEEYLEALLTRYKRKDNVGYCWDSGHDHCYPHKLDFLKSFGDRLIMTHINDNYGLRDENGVPTGDDDLHFIPFDGTIDWDKALLRLKNFAKQDILNFELKKVSISKAEEDLIYQKLSLDEFIAKAGKNAKIIAKKYDEIMD